MMTTMTMTMTPTPALPICRPFPEPALLEQTPQLSQRSKEQQALSKK
jgi:hypothetical protein